MSKKTAVVSFQRIGKKRELKHATESFFNGVISETDLIAQGHQIRADHWRLQRDAGIDFISSNDFSFYDTMLDMAMALNIVPERYINTGLTGLNLYFALARGYQNDKYDVPALPMKKWFNTNYHYIVPELTTPEQIKANSTMALEAYRAAKELTIETKPVFVGPFTFLRLSTYDKQLESEYEKALVYAYQDLIYQLGEAAWLQFDEPELVKDLSADDIAQFNRLWQGILGKPSRSKILLQTYFGDVRDAYQAICELPLDGIGLDFVHGTQTRDLIKKQPLPNNRTLFAGVINGRNIWRTDYNDVKAILAALDDYNYVINTSCSLLHVPYSVEQEPDLDADKKQVLAFAVEKLGELKSIADGTAITSAGITYNRTNSDVTNRIEALTDADFNRPDSLSARRHAQTDYFKLPLLPTTTIGSFPQTPDVRKLRRDFKAGSISQSDYTQQLQDKTKDVIKLQEDLELDVLVHGEYERNDMVEYFGEQLNGFLFTQYGWVQSYGTRCVKPPIIMSDISRKGPMTVDWITFAQNQTKKPMKGMLTGPVTILNWSFPRRDIPLKTIAYQIGLAIRDEVQDLESNGIKIIQIDEAALREGLPLRKQDWDSEYLSWAIKAFKLVHAKVNATTQIHTHMCYSDFNDIIQAIEALDADVITIEATRSKLSLLNALNGFKLQIGPGVYDIHSPRVPSEDTIIESLEAIMTLLPADQLWVNPDCGLKTRAMPEVKASLKTMVAAAKKMRQKV